MLTETPASVNSAEFRGLLSAHPLPWSVERGWTFEVTAKDGAVLAKLPTEEDATEFIALAVRISTLAA